MSENNKEVIYFFVILSLSKDLLFNSILPVKKILHYVQNDSKCKFSVYRNEYAPAILLDCRGVCYYVSEKCRLGDGDKEDPRLA